jgi:putative sigma-54 modulation protein
LLERVAPHRGPCAACRYGNAGAHSIEPWVPTYGRSVFKAYFIDSLKEHCMNLTISGHHLDVTPALRAYVSTKLDRVTRHFDQVVDINVLLTVEKLREKERRQRAEVTVHVKGRDIFVEQSHEDLYAAIDQLVDKLDRQVCRHKDRVQDHHHLSVKRLDTPTED